MLHQAFVAFDFDKNEALHSPRAEYGIHRAERGNDGFLPETLPLTQKATRGNTAAYRKRVAFNATEPTLTAPSLLFQEIHPLNTSYSSSCTEHVQPVREKHTKHKFTTYIQRRLWRCLLTSAAIETHRSQDALHIPRDFPFFSTIGVSSSRCQPFPGSCTR